VIRARTFVGAGETAIRLTLETPRRAVNVQNSRHYREKHDLALIRKVD
jgi:hypothetical protein